MKDPKYAIDPPTPWEPPEVLWAFLRELRELDQDDPVVRHCSIEVGRYLVVHPFPTEE